MIDKALSVRVSSLSLTTKKTLILMNLSVIQLKQRENNKNNKRVIINEKWNLQTWNKTHVEKIKGLYALELTISITVLRLSSMRSAMREATSAVIRSTRPGTTSFTLASMTLTSTLREKKRIRKLHGDRWERDSLTRSLQGWARASPWRYQEHA